MIKNIIFDIGNIILEGKPKNALKYINIDENSKKIIEDVIFDNPKWIELDLGNEDLYTYFEKIRKKLPKEIQEISKEILIKSHEYRNFNEDIMQLIKRMYNNYKIYILSDNNINTFNYLRTTELNKYISGWCVSALHKEIKENKKLYQILFETYNLKPNECYFIDDKLKNIEIGKDFGMQGFVLDWKENKFNDLILDMKSNDIKI